MDEAVGKLKAMGLDAKGAAFEAGYSNKAPGMQISRFCASGLDAINFAAGKVKALAVANPTRLPQLPDVPTLAEAGLKGYELLMWNALSAPAGTPRAALDRLGSALQKTLAQPDVRDRLTAMGLSVGYTAGDALAARETAYRQAWARIIKDSGYQPQ